MGSRDAARAEAYAAAHGVPRAHGSYEALLARRRARRGLHRAAERTPLRVDDAGARGGEACARREAVHAGAGAGRAGVGRGRETRPGAARGLHVAPLAADAAPALALAGARRAAGDPLVVLRSGARASTMCASFPSSAAARCSISGATASAPCVSSPGASPITVSGEARLGRGGVDERFTGTLRFGELAATFACGFHGKTNTLEVIGDRGRAPVPHAFSDPDGVVLVNGVEHRAEPGGDYREQLARLLRRDPRRASAARRASRHAGPGAGAETGYCAPPPTAVDRPPVDPSGAAASHRVLLAKPGAHA